MITHYIFVSVREEEKERQREKRNGKLLKRESNLH